MYVCMYVVASLYVFRAVSKGIVYMHDSRIKKIA